MTTYRIGELAKRSGFTTSALRYYEANDVLAPVGRTDAGYRVYDDSSVARLQFIDRAKQLGCSLDEIADLTGLLDGDECAPVQARLHAMVTDRIDDATGRAAELVALAAQLQEAARSLGGDPVDGPCGPGCACLGSTPSASTSSVSTSSEPASTPQPVALGRHDDPQITCSLQSSEVGARLADWHRLLDSVADRQPLDGGIRLVFDPAVDHGELMRLATAEQDCCTFFAFSITVDQRGLALEVRAPQGANDLVTAVFGSAGAEPDRPELRRVTGRARRPGR